MVFCCRFYDFGFRVHACQTVEPVDPLFESIDFFRHRTFNMEFRASKFRGSEVSRFRVRGLGVNGLRGSGSKAEI